MWNWTEIREWLTIGGAALAFLIGLRQYRIAQAWKRAEWIAHEMRAFFNDPFVSNALHMLDWNKRVLPLLGTVAGVSDRGTFDYKGSMLLHALTSRTHPQERPYTAEEICIRDCFDRLLDSLERIETFIEAGLVRHNELAPYLRYWMRLMGDTHNDRKPVDIVKRLWWYIDDYRYTGVQTLLRRFGYDVAVRHLRPAGEERSRI